MEKLLRSKIFLLQLLNVDKCKRRLQLLIEQDKIPEVQKKFIDPYKELFGTLSEKTGLEINNPLQTGWLYLILKTEVFFSYVAYSC